MVNQKEEIATLKDIEEKCNGISERNWEFGNYIFVESNEKGFDDNPCYVIDKNSKKIIGKSTSLEVAFLPVENDDSINLDLLFSRKKSLDKPKRILSDCRTRLSRENVMKTYSELLALPTFEERFNYLKLDGIVGRETFGFERYLNQKFYRSREWKDVRDQVIVRDNGCDLGIDDREILGKIYIHHMNPINTSDILDLTDYLLNPEYLICTTHNTHNAIHYGDSNLLVPSELVERKPNDTCPWKR